MRAGYLGALAARTLGAAPLLRPVTPSRFEPDGPGVGGLSEFSEPSEFSGHSGAQDQRTPMEPGEPAHATVPDEPGRIAWSEARLLPPVDPDRRVSAVAPPAMPHESAEPMAHDVAAPSAADTAAVGIAALAQAFALPPAAAEPGGPSRDRSAERAAPDAARHHGADQGPDPAARDGGAPPPPPVIVRIGRIDVRAGDTTPRPVLAPRPAAAQPGRSLSDHLAARDREFS